MADINRSSFLPAQISNEIIQTMQEQSAVMSLARRINVPGTGVAVPVITADPTAAWVGETAAKPVSNSEVESKLLQPYKLAVIETVSAELARDAAGLYDALIQRLPLSLATKFDNTVIGATTKPGNNFDNFAGATAQDISTNTYSALVAADADVSANGGVVNGVALSPQGRGILLGAVDGNGRPLFVNNATEGAIPMVMGAPTKMNRGLYKADTSANTVGVIGDWTQAIYGTVGDVKISISEEATLDLGSGNTLNLWQNNMIAIRAEIEIGFRANVDAFNRLTD